MERHRERFYSAVAEVVEALPSIREALRSVGSRARGRVAEMAEATRRGVDAGTSFADALERSPSPPPPHEIAVLRAAERSGTLGARLAELAQRLRADGERRRRLLGRLAYPVFLFHFAALIGAFTSVVLGSAAVAGTIAFVAVVDAAAIAIAILLTGERATRGALARAFLAVPALGRLAAQDDTARVTATLAALYGAGESLPVACRSAAAAARFEPHRREIELAAERLAAGEPAESALGEVRFFDPDARDALILSSPAGRLETGLANAANLARRRYDSGADRLTRVAAVAAYFGGAGYAAWTIFSFYGNLFDSITH